MRYVASMMAIAEYGKESLLSLIKQWDVIVLNFAAILSVSPIFLSFTHTLLSIFFKNLNQSKMLDRSPLPFVGCVIRRLTELGL